FHTATANTSVHSKISQFDKLSSDQNRVACSDLSFARVSIFHFDFGASRFHSGWLALRSAFETKAGNILRSKSFTRSEWARQYSAGPSLTCLPKSERRICVCLSAKRIKRRGSTGGGLNGSISRRHLS